MSEQVYAAMSEHRTTWRRPRIVRSGAIKGTRPEVWRCTGGCWLGFVGWHTSLQFRKHEVKP